MLSKALTTAAAGSAAGDYEISRSLRFNSADSAYLNRTPASAGNRRTWTWSGWVKRSSVGTGTQEVFNGNASTGGTSLFTGIKFIDDVLYVQDANTASYNIWWATSAVYRDPSAWYHIVVKYDTTQASSSSAVTLWVNGVQQTLTFTPFLGAYVQNRDSYVNATNAHYIGAGLTSSGSLSSNYFSGYMADINFVDGQALTPSSFGETDATTGVWKPIAYEGTYGTNGFHLDFSDNTSTTTLGYDAAGSNDWTPNNFSVTAGAGNDSLVDSPTRYGTDTGAGGEVRGNYATLNPLDSVAGNLRNANLEYYDTSGNGEYAASTMSFDIATEKYYIEYAVGTLNYNFDRIGIIPESDTGIYTGTYASSHAYYAANGNKVPANTAFGNSINLGDILGIAVGNGQIEYFKNGVSQGVLASGLTGRYKFASSGAANTHGVYNFGQRPFAHTAPSGFKALVTTNLPEPTVVQGDDYFNTVLYTGTSANQSVAVGFQPDMVWIKSRSNVTNHALFDAVRGADKWLLPNATNSESSIGLFPSFDSNGFTVSNVSGNYDATNFNTYTYASWNWKANGAGSSNTAGSIPSTVSANTTAGISIVTWTGGAGTVGHGLGVAPKMVIAKNRTTAQDWYVWFTGFTSSQYLVLNGTNAVGTSASLWNGTLPSSTVIGLDLGGTNNIVAYCFAEVEGFSKFGSYTGNGSTDGPFVYTGFRPAFVLIKRTDSTGFWTMLDNARSPFNVADEVLYANAGNAESTAQNTDFLSNGFKLKSSDSDTNSSGGTHIFMAFSSNPFKTSLAR